VDKKNVAYTLVNIILAHFFISVFAGLVFGVTHPLRFLYTEQNPYLFAISASLVAMPLYYFAGYLFILGKNSLVNMDKALLKASALFMLILLVCYGLCYILTYFKLINNAWMYYVLINYPNALPFNNISFKVDGQNLIFILSALTAPIAFYLGGLTRYKYERGIKRRG